MKRIITALIALFFCSGALAQQAGIGAPDPFVLNEGPSLPGNTNTNGLSSRTQTFNPANRNLALIVAGQSLCTNISPTTFVPGSAAVDQLNIYDGGSYNFAGGMLGASNDAPSGGGFGNVSARLAQLFITNNIFDHVVVASICIGATLASDWSTGSDALRIPVILKRFASRGITPTTTGWTFAISWWQGEADGSAGTTSAAYQASMATILSNAQSAGLSCANCRFFVNIETWLTGVTSATIQGAQAAVVTNNPTHFFTGGNTDTLNSSNRVDNTHWNDTGAAAATLLVYNAMHASGAPF